LDSTAVLAVLVGHLPLAMGIAVLFERSDAKGYDKGITECEKKINFKPSLDKAQG
jgi:hypothetical protein